MAIFSRRIAIEATLLIGLVLIGIYRNALADQVALWTFRPSAELALMIDQLDLTPHARAVLYRARPQLDDKTAFNKDCDPQTGELELGCYTHGRIYVLSITNASLKPEMTVVLAHELLHAAWAQLTAGEQSRLGTQLETAYHGLHDTDLSARMASYATSEPGQETNELHSILGSESPDLSADLEQHYSVYFADRSVITGAHAAYESVFNTRRAQLVAEAAQITTLKRQLSALEAQMNADRTRGDVPSYNALVSRQNALVQQINTMIADYETGVDEYNALSKSLDSTQISPATP